MPVAVMQIWIMRVSVCDWFVNMNVRMPFLFRKCFSIVYMEMMTIVVPVVMNMFHRFMGVLMLMRQQVCDDNSNC